MAKRIKIEILKEVQGMAVGHTVSVDSYIASKMVGKGLAKSLDEDVKPKTTSRRKPAAKKAEPCEDCEKGEECEGCKDAALTPKELKAKKARTKKA